MILKSSKNFEKFESFERLKEAWKAQNLTAGLDLYILHFEFSRQNCQNSYSSSEGIL